MRVGGASLPRLGVVAVLLAASLLFTQTRLLAGAGRPYPPCRPGAASPGVVRLHVVAASDSTRDQAAKIRVREAVAPVAARLAGAAAGPEEAIMLLGANRQALGRAAAGALLAAGARDRIGVDVGWHRFPGGTLAAGCYPSVVVTIGRGRGHNWWCVLYPPLCLPLAAAPGVAGEAAPSPGTRTSAAGRHAAAAVPPLRLRWYVAELAGRLASRLAAPVPFAPGRERGRESERLARSHMLGR